MEPQLRRLLAVILSVVVSAVAASVSLWLPPGSVRTEDRNGDGRPDVWRHYDRQGRLSEVAIDTNFDGRSDVHEYYEHGALVSRESDRNFDDRIDLVQQFDATTHDQVRVVEDVDFDGIADRLVLFQGGLPVFSTEEPSAPPAVPPAVSPGATAGSSARHLEAAPRTADDPLVPFADPFQTDLALRPVSVVADAAAGVGLSTSGGLPDAVFEAVTRLASTPASDPTGLRYRQSAILDLHSSRGPPLSHS